MSDGEVSRIQFFSEIGAIIILILSGLWYNSKPSYEPLIVFVSALGTLLYNLFLRFKNGDIQRIFRKGFSPITHWIDRNSSIAELSFNAVHNSNILNHKIKVWEIWDNNGPTSWKELRHKLPKGSWSTFDKFRGPLLELDTHDINHDGIPELLVRYLPGAHTRVLKIYEFNSNKRLELIPGAEIGSDAGEIKLKYENGSLEIHSKNRNWGGEDSMETITTIYKFVEGKFVELKKI